MARISTYYQGDMLFESQMGDHKITIDAPGIAGGGNRAPTSFDLFVASLGSCVASAIVAYCQEANIDSHLMSVDVEFDQTEPPTRIVNLKVKVNLPYGMCANQKQFLKRVAEHCPIYETIVTTGQVEFEFAGRDVAIEPV